MTRHEDSDDASELLRALAWTPDIEPFSGTERYQVLKCLGEGGFGVVYEVDDREGGRRLALKTLKPQRAGFAANIRRIKREFRSVRDLVHPNLVGLHELVSHDKRWFFTMDLVRGIDFVDYVRSNGFSEMRLRQALPQLVAGVRALHDAGIIHRDLKPSNVLVEPSGRVVILDFGLAGDDLEPELSSAGTPSFVAPELAAAKGVTTAADWYAVGVMLHEALTGMLPGANAPPPSRPTDLVRLCRVLLHSVPTERPSGPEISAMIGQPRVETPDAPHFVGRSAELAMLGDAYARLREGRGGVIRLHGQPGVGKSSLLHRFVAERPDDVLVLAGRCYAHESVPFKAFDCVIDALLTHLQSLPDHEIDALLPRDIALVAQLFPVLENVTAIGNASLERRPGDPFELRNRAFAVLKDLLTGISVRCPLVIVIDDLQWGDTDSAKLLLHLLAPPRPSALWLLSYRSDDIEQSTALRETLRMLEVAGERGTVLALDTLPQHDAETLATALLGSRANMQTARLIAQRGEGHPMFMAELARSSLAESNVPPPSNLNDILWQRVQKLASSARTLLEVVAVAGEPLDAAICSAAADLGANDLSVTRQLSSDHLLRIASDGEINVFHDRIRDAVLARVDSETRRKHHRALARVLAESPDADLESIARHFDAADERAVAADYAQRAADAAMSVLAFDRAAALYQMAIDRGLATAESYEQLGDARLAAGANAPAGRAYLEAARRCDGPRAIDLISRAGEHMCCAGDFDTGYRAVEQALEAVGERMPATVSGAAAQGIYHLTRMRLARFGVRARSRKFESIHLDVLERATNALSYINVVGSFGLMMRSSRLALGSGDPVRAACGLVSAGVGMIGNQASRPAVIDELLARAEATAIDEGATEVRALAMRRRAESYFMFGDLVSAKRECEAANAFMTEHSRNTGVHHRYVRMVEARIALFLGQLERARSIGDELVRDAIEREDLVAERLVRVCVLALVYLALDDPQQAQQQIDRATLEDRCGITVFRAESMAAIAMYQGRPRDAVKAWRSRWPKIKSEMMLSMAGCRLLAVRSLCGALLADPAHRRDIAEAARFASTIRRWDAPVAVAFHQGVKAQLAMHAGDRDEVVACLDRATAAFDAAGLVLDAATSRYCHARYAGDDLAPAAQRLQELGIVSPERWAATWLPPCSDLRF